LCPLAQTYKNEIVQLLQDWKIIQYTWHCEEPLAGKECLIHCLPCKKHEQALMYVNFIRKQTEEQDIKVEETKKIEQAEELKKFEAFAIDHIKKLDPSEMEVNSKPISQEAYANPS
jgi:hypothetical protein